MNIAIVGVGGVGGYFGARICQARERLGAQVYFIARGAHLEAIRRNGLTVRTSSEGILHCRPTGATSNIDELPQLDAGLICVKSYDLEDAVRRLAPKVSPGTELVPLLNGIDILDRISAVLPDARVYPACVFISTHIEEPGIIRQDGGPRRIIFGRAPQEAATGVPMMAGVFQQSSITSEWRDDISPALWSKYLFIAAFGMVTACFDRTLGQVVESAELSSVVRSLMQEILALATASGVRLPASIVDDSYRKAKEFPFDTKTSFQRDVAARDRPDERDLFGGAMLRLGERLAIPTPRAAELHRRIESMKPLNIT